MKKLLLLGMTIGTLMIFSACSGESGMGKITSAKEWQSKHPDVYASYLENSEMLETTYGGSVPIDYLEKYPYLKTLYEGNSFSVEYLRARGHVYPRFYVSTSKSIIKALINMRSFEIQLSPIG